MNFNNYKKWLRKNRCWTNIPANSVIINTYQKQEFGQ